MDVLYVLVGGLQYGTPHQHLLVELLSSIVVSSRHSFRSTTEMSLLCPV
jgi:hypothetical protein